MIRPLRTTSRHRRFSMLRNSRRNKRRNRSLASQRRNLLLETCEPRIVLAGVPQLIDLNSTGASNPSDFVQVDDIAFFSADDGASGRELWRTDGTPEGTSRVKDILPGPGSADPTNLTEFGGSLYFVADDGATGQELWRSDGTEAGTVVVRDINPGQGYQYPVGDGNLNSFPQGLVVLGDRLVFNAEDSATGAELWSSDGTSTGTTLIKDIAAGSTDSYYGNYPNSSAPQDLVEVNGTLFFSADDGVNGRELWKSDGTSDGTVLVKDIFTGSAPYYYDGNYYGDYPNSSSPSQLTAVDGLLFFAAGDETNGTELWKSDGTTEGTVLVKDIQPGSESGLYGDNSLIEFQGRLLFAGENDDLGKELWISDGTEVGTELVKDVRTGTAGGITSGYLTAFNGEVFFAADDGSSGTELWKTDGTETGTVLVANLDTSTSGSFPRYLTDVNGRLYFSAFTADLGRELWESDGTSVGTVPVDDLLGGTGSSSPRELSALDQRLLFSADNGTDGRELFSVRAGDQLFEATLTIYVDSQAVEIPANIGVSADGTPLSQVRSLGTGGSLIVSPISDEPLENVTLGDFFATWQTNAGQAGDNPDATFDSNELMGNLADTTDTVQMFLNGQISTRFDEYVIQGGDQVVLIFGSNPVVSLNTNFGAVVMELFAEATPGTVDNFLNYVNDGDYLNSFFHRSVPGFVIQAGGFVTTSTTFTGTDQFSSVPTDATIQNEPGISNLRGTVAMAKLGGNPDSATSQFFVNLNDDNAFLDTPQNNSFTVFAQVLDMSVVDVIASVPIDTSNSSPYGELPVSDDDQLVVVGSVAGQGRVSGTKFLDANGNGVFDNGETALAGVTIFVDSNENGQQDAGEISTTTDSDGRYLLELSPGLYRINASVSDGRRTTLPPDALGYEIELEIGREESNLNFGEDTLSAPTAIDLIAGSDTGQADDDDLTRQNNATAEAVLQFQVDGVVNGATVRLFSNGTLIGTATATDGFATVSTDGVVALADGTYNFTATQEVLGSESSSTSALLVTVDTASPADIASTAPNVARIGEVYSFDSDSPDEGSVTYALDNAPAGMTIDSLSGVVSWTPAGDQTVPQQFEIQVIDDAGNISSQSVDLTVLSEVPAFPDQYSVDEDGNLAVDASAGVLANDGDQASGTLTATLVSDPTNGTVTLNSDGSFTYTPDADFFGQDSFRYEATDGNTTSNVALVTIDVQDVNDVAAPIEDAYTTPEDTPLVIDATQGVLANDIDVDGDSLTAVLANQPSRGTLSLNDDGSFTYTPDPDFFGTDSFAYRASDGTVQSDPISVELTVTAVDDAPTAVADSYTVNENDELNVTAADGVLANDDTPDGDSIVTLIEAPANGTIALNADGSFTYSPQSGFAGADSFTYSVSNSVGQSITAATITVVDQPDPPTANDDTFEVAGDGVARTLNVLANDTFSPDLDDSLTVVSVTQGSQGGTVTLSDGEISYQPAAGVTGTETFDYTIEDSDALQSTATVTVTISEAEGNSLSGFAYLDRNGNDQRDANEIGIPGVLISVVGTTSTGDEITRTMLTTDDGLYAFTELPAGTYRIVQQQPAATSDGGESSPMSEADLATNDQISNIVISGRQAFTDNNFGESQILSAYVSIAWFFASSTTTSDVFRETIAMGEESAGNMALAAAIRGDSETPTTPTPPNSAPVASPDDYVTDEATPLNVSTTDGVLANDFDPNGDSITATIDSDVSNGTLVLDASGSFTYTPDAGFVGDDRFSYTATDGLLTSNTVDVTITVEAAANTFSIPENSPTGSVVGRVQLGDGETLSYQIDDPTLDDDLRLRPDDHLSGDPASALVLIEYIDLQCSACKAIHPVVKELEDDFDGELLVVRRHFPLVDTHSNAFAAAVASEAAGRQDKFDEMVDLMLQNQDEWKDAADPHSVFDGFGNQLGLNLSQFDQDISDPALTARVQRDADAAGRLGAASTPTFYLNGQTVDFNDATNDFEAIIEDALQDFDEAFVINRITGDIVVADGNLLDFEQTPIYTFDVIGNDADGNAISRSVTINVTDVNEAPPIAFADTYSLDLNTTFTVDSSIGVLNNDTDADNDDLTAILVTNPTSGTVTLNSNGSFVYVPDTDFTGTDSFAYQASDGAQTSNIATVTLNVDSDNTAPAPISDVYFTTQDTPLSIGAAFGVLSNDDDADGDTLTAILVESTPTGQLTFNDDGSFTYTPPADFTGADSFTYRASDGKVSSEAATVTINVSPSNTPPVAVDDDYDVDEDTTLTVAADIGLLSNDLDNDLNSLSVQLIVGPTNGSLSLSPNGSFTYAPTADFTGTDTFTYQARDGVSNSSTATVTITVNGVIPLNSFRVFENTTAGTLVGQIQLTNAELDGDIVFQLEDDQLDPLLQLAPDDHLSGSPTSTVVLIEYIDFQCPACQVFHPVVNQLESDFAGELLVVRRHLPLVSIHDNAFDAAIASEAAGRQDKFDEMSDILFEKLDDWEGVDDPQSLFESYATDLGLDLTQFVSDLSDPALAARVQRDADAAGQLGVASTPTYFLQGDVLTELPASLNEFSNLVQTELDLVDDVFRLNRATGQLLVRDSAALDFETTTSFTISVRATDLDGDTEVIQVTVSVVDVGENPPQSNPDTYTVDQGSVLTVDGANGILANDVDDDGDSLFPRVDSDVSHGTLLLQLNGAFTYTPDNDFSGIDTFVYQVSDGSALSELTTVTLNVTPVDSSNQAPVANDDSYVTPADSVLSVEAALGVLANDNDVDGDAIIAQIVSQPARGTLILAADGTFQYTPDAEFNGTDSFTYLVNDGEADSANATVTITVTPPNTFIIPEGSRARTDVGQVVSLSDTVTSPALFELVRDGVDPLLNLASDDHLSGDPTASVVLIEYLDFQCPACRAFHPVVQQLEDDFAGDLLVVRRYFPLTTGHANAMDAAIAAEAAGRQGRFDAMGDLLFENQDAWAAAGDPQSLFESYATELQLDLDQFRNDQNDTALSDRVQRDLDNALTLGVNATPTYYLQGQKLTQLPNSLADFSTQVQAEVDNVDDLFYLDRTTGKLTVRDAVALDFEISPTHTVDVRITDADGNTEVVTITVLLTDINDQGNGAVLAASLVDDAMAEDKVWL